MTVTALIQSPFMRLCDRPRWAPRAAAERCLPLPECASWAPAPLANMPGGRAGRGSGFSHLFLVGNGELATTADGYKRVRPDGKVEQVKSPDELKDRLLPLLRPGDTVLFKGPRNAGMVKAVRDLSGAIAQRCLWINLAAIEGNIARFRRHCGSGAHSCHA